MSLSCRVSAISAFCCPTTQPLLTNRLVAIVDTKPVIAILVPKLVAMATFHRTSKLAMSSLDSLTPKTHPWNHSNSTLLGIIQPKLYPIESQNLVAMWTSLSTSGPPSNTWFLWPIWAHNPNGISIGSAVFAQMTVEYPYTLQWDAPSPQKIAPSHGGSGPPSNTWSLGPPKSSNQTASRSVQLFLQGWLVWQTDTQSYSVGNNRLHLYT